MSKLELGTWISVEYEKDRLRINDSFADHSRSIILTEEQTEKLMEWLKDELEK